MITVQSSPNEVFGLRTEEDWTGLDWTGPANLCSGQTTLFDEEWAYDQLNGRGMFIIIKGGISHVYGGNFVNGRLEGLGTYSGGR